MDYSKHNNEKKRKKIRSNAAKSRKKVSFNIFRFHGTSHTAYHCRQLQQLPSAVLKASLTVHRIFQQVMSCQAS